jgi:hypothetical protein
LFLFDRYQVHTEVFPKQEAIMRKFFGSSPPPVIEAERNMSLLIISSNSVFNYPIPLMPSIVTIHSLHVKTTTNPLPKVRNRQSAFFFHITWHMSLSVQEVTYCAIPLVVTKHFFSNSKLAILVFGNVL